MKEADLRKLIEEMKEDSDDENPMQHADLDDDEVLAKLLDQVEYADLDNFEVAEELYEQVLEQISKVKIS